MALLRNCAESGDAGVQSASLACDRLQAQAGRLLQLRCAAGDEAGNEGGDEATRAEVAALRGTVREVCEGLPGQWPANLGFRLYCSLLEATFETDEPAAVAADAPQVLQLFEGAWGALRVGPRAHDLALLTTSFSHYQQYRYAAADAPQLLATVSEALGRVLAAAPPPPRRGAAAAAPAKQATYNPFDEEPRQAAAAEGGAGAEAEEDVEWLQLRRDILLAGIVGFLGGKLRDYRAHYGSEPEELAACVALWRRYAPPPPQPQPQPQHLPHLHHHHHHHHHHHQGGHRLPTPQPTPHPTPYPTPHPAHPHPTPHPGAGASSRCRRKGRRAASGARSSSSSRRSPSSRRPPHATCAASASRSPRGAPPRAAIMAR